MKNSNIIKNNTLYKFFILTILIIIPVGILYFNFENQILFNNNIVKENLVNNNLINICNSKQAHFYDLDVRTTGGGTTGVGTSLHVPDNALITGSSLAKTDCQHECEKNYRCNFYIERGNNCVLYDLSKNNFEKLKVNCSNKQIPNTDGLYKVSGAPFNIDTIYNGNEFTASNSTDMHDRNNINRGYLGEGKIKRDYYNDHLDKFDHIDFNLNESNNIKNKYNEIFDLIKNGNNLSDTEQTTQIDTLYTEVNTDISNLAGYLGLSRNYLHSSFIQYPNDAPNNNPYGLFKKNDDGTFTPRNFTLDGLDVSYATMLDMFHKNYDKSDDIESRLNNDNLEKNRKNLIYTILIILMILSVIIIVIFKINPNIISDKILLIYFTGILILLFFINYYFKV